MKKFVVLFTFCLALSGAVGAQEIKASPFEGRWVWELSGSYGSGYRDMTELVFFGNVMLGMNRKEPVYEGDVFTYTNQIIDLDGEILQYRLNGNTLTITDEDDEQYRYTKAKTTKSPLEGIWMDEDEDEFMLFTADIMAFSRRYNEYRGFKIDFNGKQFYPSLSYMPPGEDVSEEDLKKMTMEYSLSGKTLTITLDNKKALLVKVY